MQVQWNTVTLKKTLNKVTYQFLNEAGRLIFG